MDNSRTVHTRHVSLERSFSPLFHHVSTKDEVHALRYHKLPLAVIIRLMEDLAILVILRYRVIKLQIRRTKDGKNFPREFSFLILCSSGSFLSYLIQNSFSQSVLLLENILIEKFSDERSK